MRVTQLNWLNWRATTRLALRSVTMLAVLTALSLTQLLANPFNVTVRSGPGVRYIASPTCAKALRSSAFTANDFSAARNGSLAAVVGPRPGWISSLPADPQARWVAFNADREARTMLLAQPFELPCLPSEDTVTLTFFWAADDRLGDLPPSEPNLAGVYINGTAIPISGGGHDSQSSATVAIPSNILNAGVNWLYVYVRDVRCIVSGVIYSATFRGLCHSCTRDIEQPWNRCMPSTPSAVVNCDLPSIGNLFTSISADDFIATYSGTVNTVEWWGTLSRPLQRFFPFLIAFYQDERNCQPILRVPVFQACVIALARQVGVDCEGRRVWHFKARLPEPFFQQVAGRKYWLVISEIDSVSLHRGQVDFQWSGHAACNNCAGGELVCNCRAVRIMAENGQFVVNPVRGCNNEVIDLAWALRRQSRIQFNFARSTPSNPVTVRFHLPEGAFLEEHLLIVEEYIDADGTTRYGAVLDTGLPEGEYEVELIASGAAPIRQRIDLSTNTPVNIDCSNMLWGDINSDGRVDDADLLILLFNFGAGR